MRKTNNSQKFPPIQTTLNKIKKQNTKVKTLQTNLNEINKENKSIQYNQQFKISLNLKKEEQTIEGINNIIHEYLIKMNMNKTLECFQKELKSSKQIKIENYITKIKKAFKNGQEQSFFDIWSKYIPLSLRIHDKQTVIVEFYMNIYFCIYKLKQIDITQKHNISFDLYSNVIKNFKNYLFQQGDELTKIDELLPYFALPYLKDPLNHPFFKNLFNDSWSQEIQYKLNDYLNSLYKNDSKPFLITLYEKNLQDNFEDKSFDFDNTLQSMKHKDFCDKQKPSIFQDQETPVRESVDNYQTLNSINFETKNFIKKLETDNKNMLQLIEELHEDNKKLKKETQLKKKQIDTHIYQELQKENQILKDKLKIIKKEQKQIQIQNQVNWVQFSKSLLEICNSLYQFALMFKKGREDYITSIERKIVEFNSFIQQNEQKFKNDLVNFKNNISKEVPIFRPVSIKTQIFDHLDNLQQIREKIISKDYKILISLNDYFESFSDYQLRVYSIIFLEEDFLDINSDDQDTNICFQLLQSDQKLQFYRFLDKFSIDFLFRGYLLKNDKLVQYILKDYQDTHEEECLQTILIQLIQKFTLRLNFRQNLVNYDILDEILQKLKNIDQIEQQKRALYLNLILNVSLEEMCRKKISNNKDILNILQQFLRVLDECNILDRYLIHGIFYSLSLNQNMKVKFQELQIVEKLKNNKNNLDPEFQDQIELIEERILSQTEVTSDEIQDKDQLSNDQQANWIEENQIKMNEELQQYIIQNMKEKQQYQILIKSYFTLFFKQNEQNVEFDVSIQNQRILRPSTPSQLYSKLSQSFQFEYTQDGYSNSRLDSPCSKNIPKSQFFQQNCQKINSFSSLNQDPREMDGFNSKSLIPRTPPCFKQIFQLIMSQPKYQNIMNKMQNIKNNSFEIVNFKFVLIRDLNKKFYNIYFEWAFFIANILLSFQLISILSEDYLSIAINFLAQDLDLPKVVTAMIIVTYANGTPDILDTIISSQKPNSIQAGLSGLLGAFIFASTIVVQNVIKHSQKVFIELPKFQYLKELCLYGITILFIFIIPALIKINYKFAYVFLILYLIYLFLSIIYEYFFQNLEFRKHSFPEFQQPTMKKQVYHLRKNTENFNDRETLSNTELKNDEESIKLIRQISFNFNRKVTLYQFFQNIFFDKKNKFILDILLLPFRIIFFITIPNIIMYVESKRKPKMISKITQTLCLFIGTIFSFYFLFQLQLKTCLIYGIILQMFSIFSLYFQRQAILKYIILLIQILSSMTWIKIISTTMINSIFEISQEFNISGIFLYSVIISNGNTLSDYFNNAALASLGQSTIAIMSCFTGQLFNLLIGLFLNIYLSKIRLIDIIGTYSQIEFDNIFIIVLILFSLGSIFLNLIITRKNHFSYTKSDRKYLISYYFLFLVTTIFVIIFFNQLFNPIKKYFIKFIFIYQYLINNVKYIFKKKFFFNFENHLQI